MVNADNGAFVQVAGDEFADAVEVGDKIAKGFKSHTRARLTELARLAMRRNEVEIRWLACSIWWVCRCRGTRRRSSAALPNHFGSKSATRARSSFNSFTVASIFARLNSLSETP